MAKPLTKRNKDGKLYARRASVEAAIELAQTQDLNTLRSRLWITDRDAAEYLETEVLAHLMRDARRGMNAQLMEALFPALLKRCESNLLAFPWRKGASAPVPPCQSKRHFQRANCGA
jgi:hypothetical protein